MSIIGITDSEQKDLFACLQGLLLLSDVTFHEAPGDACSVSKEHLSKIEELWGISNQYGSPVERALTILEGYGSGYSCPHTLDMATKLHCGALGHFYRIIFDWITEKMNQNLQSQSPSLSAWHIHICTVRPFRTNAESSFYKLFSNSMHELVQYHCSEGEPETREIFDTLFGRTGLLRFLSDVFNQKRDYYRNTNQSQEKLTEYAATKPLISVRDSNGFYITHSDGEVYYPINMFDTNGRYLMAANFVDKLLYSENELILHLFSGLITRSTRRTAPYYNSQPSTQTFLAQANLLRLRSLWPPDRNNIHIFCDSLHKSARK